VTRRIVFAFQVQFLFFLGFTSIWALSCIVLGLSYHVGFSKVQNEFCWAIFVSFPCLIIGLACSYSGLFFMVPILGFLPALYWF